LFADCPNTSDAELAKKIAAVKVFASTSLDIEFHSSFLTNTEIARCVPVNKRGERANTAIKFHLLADLGSSGRLYFSSNQ
jgi:hypothetical protein